MRSAAVALALVALAACGDSSSSRTVDAATGGPAIAACADVDATTLTSATIDDLVARYQGRACTSPLAGGDRGLQQECQYGAQLSVCGQSAGLAQLGCRCEEGGLFCSNGEAIKAGQERLCGDAGVE